MTRILLKVHHGDRYQIGAGRVRTIVSCDRTREVTFKTLSGENIPLPKLLKGCTFHSKGTGRVIWEGYVDE